MLGALAVLLLALGGCAERNQARIYAEYAHFMVNTGRFRQESAPKDAPFSQADLIRNFQKVVFVPEKQLAAFYAKRQGPRRLSKWTNPIRYAVVGDGVRETDRLAVASIMDVLSRRTGLSIEETAGRPSLKIFILSDQARRAAEDASQPWYDSSLFRDWVETLNPPCFAQFDASTSTGGRVRYGAVFIKAELENPLRGACLIEELTQSMGLIFDHEDVRPSIFNDDQEFIALTLHDELLLQILYDDRLTPGMTQEEAAPIVRRIVSEMPPETWRGAAATR